MTGPPLIPCGPFTVIIHGSSMSLSCLDSSLKSITQDSARYDLLVTFEHGLLSSTNGSGNWFPFAAQDV
jgi:DNA-binding transcriptional ArsR family regulator